MDFSVEYTFVTSFYGDDLQTETLHAQLLTFATEFKRVFLLRIIQSPLYLKYFSSLTAAQRSLLSQVSVVLKLVLIMPATNSTSERSFSALRRVKTYLRNTMGQERLNNLMVLHVHKEITDKLDLISIANEFVGDSDHRLKFFGAFS